MWLAVDHLRLFVLGLLLWPWSAMAGDDISNQRLFFSLSNQNYKVKQQQLDNPHKDAELLAHAFSGLGYRVDKRKDLATKDDFSDAIASFKRQMKQRQLGIFYYVGHGRQVGKTQYIYPTQTNLDHKNSHHSAFSISRLKHLLTDGLAADKLVLIIIDACRSYYSGKGIKHSQYHSFLTQEQLLPLQNPMEQLAETVAPKYNLMTWYSAKENQSAHDRMDGIDNGPFALMLARQLNRHKTIRQLAGEVSASMFEFLAQSEYPQQTPYLDVGEGAKRFYYRQQGQFARLADFDVTEFSQPSMAEKPDLTIHCLRVMGEQGCLGQVPLTDQPLSLLFNTTNAPAGALIWASLTPQEHDLKHFIEPVSAYCSVDVHGECLVTLDSAVGFGIGSFVVEAQLYVSGQSRVEVEQQYNVINPRR